MTPALVLTSGEPAGIAPDITAKAWTALRHRPDAAFFLIGDAEYFAGRAKSAGTAIPFQEIDDPKKAHDVFARALPVLHRPLSCHPKAGIIDPATAKQVIASIAEGVALVTSGAASALVTNPIQKDALYQAGFRHQGHTDYLASLAGSGQEVMMLVGGGLRAIPVTVHVALKDVPRLLTADLIMRQARVAAESLRMHFGIASPRLTVTGLNPHAGENGAMGREEIDIIIPAIAQLAAEGLDIRGPVSADTAFAAAMRETYDAVLCMYHDQALIPVKTLDFDGGVNVTLGLPFIRTSPDHGTALNIAGAGTANARSLVAAIELAAEMAARAHG
jgi:4-hydroxythreonine-4-phosphate dehydrogenase